MRMSWPLAGIGLVLSAGAGWIVAPLPEDGPAREGANPGAIVLHHGSEIAAINRTRFERLNPPPPPPAPAPDPALPPPPDIAVLFRRDLTAIERAPTQRIAWIVDFNGEHSRRALHTGQIYQNGWVVASIADQEVVLRKKRETRRIQLYDPPEPETP